MADALGEYFAKQPPEVTSRIGHLLPLPHLEPTDITGAMVYLCGRSGRGITGIALPVDSGYSAK
jgi:hypothetical protein